MKNKYTIGFNPYSEYLSSNMYVDISNTIIVDNNYSTY